MREKELQLVTFEQAKKLESLGFDWKTQWYYSIFKTEKEILKDAGFLGQWNNGQENLTAISAPTVALALKWVRDEKNFYGFCDKNLLGWCFEIYKADNGGIVYVSHIFDKVGETYEDAESALLDKLLIFIQKEKKQ
jgi:hypothetical protein